MKKKEINSGGAIGTDTKFENEADKRGLKCNAFSYKTSYHKSKNKVEISEEDFKEGIKKVLEANKVILKRPISEKSSFINLLARNWAQVKYSDIIVAVGYIVQPKAMGTKYVSKASIETVDGGTGYAVAMAMMCKKPIYVYDLKYKTWFVFLYDIKKFVSLEGTPKVEEPFDSIAGIGTRELNNDGEKQIEAFLDINF